MAITAKPATYVVNTGATHCPDHLYMMDEAAGITLTDAGKTGGYNLTLSGTTGDGPDWTTDGTHGPILDFVAANVDRAVNTSVSGLSGVQTIAVLVNAQLGTTQRWMAQLSDPSQADRYVGLIYQADEDVECDVRFDDTDALNTSTQALTHGSWDFVAIRCSDTIYDWSLNGSAWAAAAHSHSGMIAAVTAFALGCKYNSAITSGWDDMMCAAMWWHGDKSDAEIATIYNTGDIWTQIGVGPAGSHKLVGKFGGKLRGKI